MNTRPEFRLVPALRSGSAWFVEVETGSRRKGTRRSVAISDAVYTLAQAQAFCSNNRARDFSSALEVRS